jgi:hypothetical protein
VRYAVAEMRGSTEEAYPRKPRSKLSERTSCPRV